MKNSIDNKSFLNKVSEDTKGLILKNVANHYGITTEAAYFELIDDEAENILEYITGDLRAVIHTIYKSFKF